MTKLQDNSTWDNIFEHIISIEGEYIALMQRVETTTDTVTGSEIPIRKGILFNESFQESGITKQDHPILEQEDAMAERDVSLHRTARNIRDDNEMVVGLAFTTPAEIRQFRLFHTVLHIDATADTNNENRPLVTVSSKDSTGKMFMVLRCFMPNEQAWAYKWLFKVVFPALLGSKYVNDVSMILTDGDNQTIIQLEQAIDKRFGFHEDGTPKVERARCSWHIIDRGWFSHVKYPLGGLSRKRRPKHLLGTKRPKPKELTAANQLSRKIYRWLFSWAQPGYCETEEEFLVSKALCVAFLKSKEVGAVLGDEAGKLIIDFIRQYISPHEAKFCYHIKHFIFHLETHSNTNLEGMFNGIKHGSTPVGPQNSMDKAITVLMDNADIKIKDTMIEMWSKTNSTKLWSDTPTANFVTNLCESMLITVWRKAKDWIPHRAAHYQWLVAHIKETECADEKDHLWEWDDEDDEEKTIENKLKSQYETVAAAKKWGIIPKFQRVYEVTVDLQHGCFKCKCGSQERMGFPCCHIACVVQGTPELSVLHKKGFPVTAIRVFWRLEYYLYGMSTKTEYRAVREALQKLADSDTMGLKCPPLEPKEYDKMPDDVLLVASAPANARVLNYTSSQVVTAISLSGDQNNPTILPYGDHPGYSQTSHFGEGNHFEFAQDDGGDESYQSEDNSSHDIFEKQKNHFDVMIQSDVAEVQPQVRDVLMKEFEDMVQAIQNSDSKEDLQKQVREMFQEITAKAVGSCHLPMNDTSKGKRQSMKGPSNKKKKTHGTKHMQHNFIPPKR
jgi:hypothetical protein